jgi:hypothetical protein
VSPSPTSLTRWNYGESWWVDPAPPSLAAGRRFLWANKKEKSVCGLLLPSAVPSLPGIW